LRRIDIEKVLTLLAAENKKQLDTFNFEDPATEENIQRIEHLLGIELPKSYREFLLKFDGGFICTNFLAAKIKLHNDIETAKWNSLNILSLEEMHQEYVDLSDRNWKMPLDWDGVYPLVPFARTNINELLVFVQPLNPEFESPVFDAFHEDPVYDWGVLYDNFSEFLKDYLSQQGMLKTISSAKAETIQQFLPESGWKQKPEDYDDPEMILQYNFELLKKEPDSISAFINMAEAMDEKKEYLSAKFYIGKALKIDPNDTYAHCIRSRILANQELHSDAVEAITTAISLSGNPAFYYVLRCNYYTELKEYKKALIDCNKSMELDPNSSYTYLCRSELNSYFENHEQAFLDIQKAVELEPENPLALSILAYYYLERKDYHKTIELCTEAIKHNPVYIKPYRYREQAYRALGEIKKADLDNEIINDLLSDD
jgi:tetratricopeptide (TPR) repeat protein